MTVMTVALVVVEITTIIKQIIHQLEILTASKASDQRCTHLKHQAIAADISCWTLMMTAAHRLKLRVGHQ